MDIFTSKYLKIRLEDKNTCKMNVIFKVNTWAAPTSQKTYITVENLIVNDAEFNKYFGETFSKMFLIIFKDCIFTTNRFAKNSPNYNFIRCQIY